MLTAPTSSTLFVVANEDIENRAVEVVGVGLVVSTQHLGVRVSHPVDTSIL